MIKHTIIAFVTLSLLACVNADYTHLYSMTASSESVYDLVNPQNQVVVYPYSFNFSQIYGESGYNNFVLNNIVIWASIPDMPNSIAKVFINSLNGASSVQTLITLPQNVNNDEIYSFSKNYFNRPNLYFVAKSGNSITLNIYTDATMKTSQLISLFNSPVQSITGTLDTSSQYYVVLAVINNQYSALWIDVVKNTIVSKAAFKSSKPASAYSLISLNKTPYVLELVSGTIRISELNFQLKSLNTITAIKVAPNVSSFTVYFDTDKFIIIANSNTQSTLFTIDSTDFSVQNSSDLSTPLLPNSIIVPN